MPERTVDVLVVGAGPVGLTMAAALHHYGLTCRIVDKAAVASDKSKALVVWSRTLELLDNLHLADTFVKTGLKATGASVYSGGKRISHVTIAGVQSPFGYPLMIPQNETERLLAAHLTQQGIRIERSVELTSFREEADAVACTLRHTGGDPDGQEESLRVPWLIGCDGAHSAVRHGLNLPFVGDPEPNDWLLADVHIEGPIAKDEISVFWHRQGVLVYFPITRDRCRIIADIGTAKGDKPPDPTLAEVQAVVDERGPGGLTLSDPVWLAGFRINERKVTDYRRGRVMLAGDAAHIHSPAGGQGMNTGMQDAFNLAWKLALANRGRGKIDALLNSYSVERSAVGDQVLHAAGRMTVVATLRNPVAQYLRNHVAGVAMSFGFVQDKFKNALCELSINYRHSPLSQDDWLGHGGELAAGDRMPDAPLAPATGGAPTSLFAVLRGTRHNLLLFPGPHGRASLAPLLEIAERVERDFPDLFAAHRILTAGASQLDPSATPANIAAWLDVEGQLQQQIAADDRAVIVVRPDGYIGYRGQPADAARLEQYLDRYLVRKT
jgi:2-polyprenyl-6-methoxyphenol hydroxylase-like FAD-dependent oxidoreductase